MFDRDTKKTLIAQRLSDNIKERPQELLFRFKREIDIITGLNHPNLRKILEIGESQGSYFLVMEDIDAVSLPGYLAGGESIDRI